jgi:Tfp pilus assembly protein PilV
MDCKPTFTDRRRARQTAGVALMELMIAVALGMVAVLAILALFAFSGRNFAAMANYADLDRQSRKALDVMTMEIRNVRSLNSYSTNALVFTDADGATLQYTYSPGARTLTRSKGLQSEVLLKECDTLTFQAFQRNTISNSFDQYAATTNSTAKLIRVSWICSRTIFGLKMNTESVQSAKIVIRNG